MNQQFTQLANEAQIGLFEDKSFGWSVIAGTDQHLEKFAELIVKECVLGIKMTMVRDGYDTKHYLQSMKHIDYIRKQFGVEE